MAFHAQPKIPLPPTSTDLTDKTIIVTGSNTGLGYGTALSFLQLGASTVVLAVRSVVRGEAAAKHLLADPIVRSRTPLPSVRVMHLDLSNYASTVSFADSVLASIPALDLLVLNAGLGLAYWSVSLDGHEMVLQVNLLSSALLALLLLPLLRRSAEAKAAPTRITWVGSEGQDMHSLARHPVASDESVLGHFDDKAKYGKWTRYMDSKLLVSIFVKEFAARVNNDKVVINNFCPGMVATNIQSNVPWYLSPAVRVYTALRARTVEEGARTAVHAAVVAGAETHGLFIKNNQVSSLAAFAQTKEGQAIGERLWAEVIEELTAFDKRVGRGMSKV